MFYNTKVIIFYIFLGASIITLLKMKTLILHYLSGLIESEDTEEKHNIREQVVPLILSAKLDLTEEHESQTKGLIIATINNYADTGDAALKEALKEHYKALDLLLDV